MQPCIKRKKMHFKQMHALQSYGGERDGSFNYTQEMMTGTQNLKEEDGISLQLRRSLQHIDHFS